MEEEEFCYESVERYLKEKRNDNVEREMNTSVTKYAIGISQSVLMRSSTWSSYEITSVSCHAPDLL